MVEDLDNDNLLVRSLHVLTLLDVLVDLTLRSVRLQILLGEKTIIVL